LVKRNDTGDGNAVFWCSKPEALGDQKLVVWTKHVESTDGLDGNAFGVKEI